MDKQISFGDALEQNNYTLVSEYITEITDQLKVNLINLELDALEESIEREKTYLSYYVKKELVQHNIDLYLDVILDLLMPYMSIWQKHIKKSR